VNATPIARRLWTLLWEGRRSAGVLAVVAGLAALVVVSAAAATTTTPFTTIYSYDRVAPNAQVARANISAGLVATPTLSAARRYANAGLSDFVAAEVEPRSANVAVGFFLTRPPLCRRVHRPHRVLPPQGATVRSCSGALSQSGPGHVLTKRSRYIFLSLRAEQAHDPH
jgi:hypothetical protein